MRQGRKGQGKYVSFSCNLRFAFDASPLTVSSVFGELYKVYYSLKYIAGIVCKGGRGVEQRVRWFVNISSAEI